MIEIFQEVELMELSSEDKALEWFDMCTELGLEYQLSLASKSEDKKVPPYQVIDERTARIIRTLCPVGIEYKKYTQSAIPLDVLQEIKKCEHNGWYEEIKIFYDNQSPDPFVVGLLPKIEGSWTRTRHLIARWGTELIPWELLEVKAVHRLKDACVSSLQELKYKVELGLKDPESFIRQLMNGKARPEIDFRVQDLAW